MLKCINHQQLKEKEKEIEQKIEEKIHNKFLNLSKRTAYFFGSEFKKQTSTAIIAAFGFLIALVWRDFITILIQQNIKTEILSNHPYLSQLYTAIIITLISAVGIALIAKWAQDKKA